jgi:lipoprotein-releasing system permease protein
LQKIPGIRHIQVFATKPGIIKTKTEIQGVYLKGVDKEFDWSFFQKHLVEGQALKPGDSIASNQIVISSYLAGMLKLKTGDPLVMYFVQDPPRIRKFTIAGIYETGLEEFDKTFALVDLMQIRQLNNWDQNQVGGYEIFISDFEDLYNMQYRVRETIGYGIREEGDNLRVSGILEKYPQIFDWLGLFDMNVKIIIILMLFVAGINMVSGLLVIILERTNMIGILKALGTENYSIRKLFLYLSGFLVLRGLFWGNLIGLALCAVQYYTGVFTLDPEAYFLSRVPISFQWGYFLLLNIGTLLVVLLILLLPSLIISRINPSKTIRFK